MLPDIQEAARRFISSGNERQDSIDAWKKRRE